MEVINELKIIIIIIANFIQKFFLIKEKKLKIF
jgi:hypothetical protein